MQRVATASLALVAIGLAAIGWAASPRADGAQDKAGASLFIDGASSTAERRDLAAWANETEALLRSPGFLADLQTVAADHKEISLGSFTGVGTPARLVDFLRLTGENNLVRSPVGLVGGQGDYTALSGQNGERENNILVTSMSLGRGHLARWRSADLVEKSCAVNTMAHELSHLVSSDRRWHNPVFEDTGANLPPLGGPTPIASYLIGSVAQCHFLIRAGRIPQTGLKDCVATFGTSDFRSLQCTRHAGTGPIRADAAGHGGAPGGGHAAGATANGPGRRQ